MSRINDHDEETRSSEEVEVELFEGEPEFTDPPWSQNAGENQDQEAVDA